jgi:hypothetical protein
LIALAIVLILGWVLLPQGYDDVIAIFAPHIGNYVRPTVVLMNLLLVNPMSNFTMVAIWAGAGFIGGIMAGTKKGAFVVGLVTWLSCLALAGLLVYIFFTQGLFDNLFTALTSFVVPPGSSIANIIGIPLIQGVLTEVLPLISSIFGGGGGGLDMTSLFTILTPFLIWFFTPAIVVIIGAIVGAVVRPKEEF